MNDARKKSIAHECADKVGITRQRSERFASAFLDGIAVAIIAASNCEVTTNE